MPRKKKKSKEKRRILQNPNFLLLHGCITCIAGEVILREEPYVSAPKSFASEAVPVCQGCFKTSNLKKCSACQLVWYCGRSCQLSDWKMHRLECRAISRLDKNWRNVVAPDICLMVKLHLRRKLQSDKIIPTTATDNYKLVETLVAHMSSISEREMLLYARKAEIVKLILQWPDFNVKQTVENFSKGMEKEKGGRKSCFKAFGHFIQLSRNTHTITGSQMEALGIGLYLVISLINHSCSPNSVLVFEGKEAVIRAVQQIRKGDEVFVSYIDTGAATTSRQNDLLKQYFFTCTCSRCLSHDPVYDEIDGSFNCMNDKCSGVYESNFDVKEFLSAKKKRENFLKEFCGPSSILLTKVQSVLLEDYINLGDMQKALEYCRLTMPTYQRVYAGLHPLLGLRYYTSAKLEWINGNKVIAVDHLNKAVDILKVTHGTETQFMKELFGKLEKARAGGPCEF
ncbi:hypothetical protein COLO4_38230 [Corchorus olitorius]|uniref:SET domain-containing protein n=1 Tax=Corchorus olitorius TaxID=93759 RepID=A0A1R3FW88_9ROSI|nr:hypothetical protein COLO4_38230 [Corchorus olitorius]